MADSSGGEGNGGMGPIGKESFCLVLQHNIHNPQLRGIAAGCLYSPQKGLVALLLALDMEWGVRASAPGLRVDVSVARKNERRDGCTGHLSGARFRAR